ncbi:MAG: hypothetical protein CVT77_12220 [Alphaproteobacteria bacterium HGW-Alphaproteobacteria-16]|nr:MAG: hypothetical protein CVT77_12220 [Alphaproteobacteria bacterium HGW-Alphaproteobacteria-16]
MATRVDPLPDVSTAADRLIEACAAAVCVRFETDGTKDALAAGVAAVGRIYDRAPAPRRKPRRKS